MGEEFSKQSRGHAIWMCGIAALLLFVGYLLFRRIVVGSDGLGGYPRWRLNVEDSKWYLVSASETPVKSDDESSREK